MRPLVTLTRLLALTVLIAITGGCQANKPVTMELRSFPDDGSNTKPAQGPGGEPALEIRANAGSGTTWLADCDKPAITSPDYVLRGRVKYDNLTSGGYLELSNDFGHKGTYFTRSLDNEGPIRTLSGTSDWRDFELPFHAEPGTVPQSLALGVAISGPGTVTVAGPLIVAPLNLTGGWWSERQARLIGGGLGTLGGLLGSLIGIAGALRKFALARALCGVGLAAGAVSLIAGLVAVCVGQPWHVWYPLLLLGFISMTVCGPLLAVGSRLFQADELRRMTGLDAM